MSDLRPALWVVLGVTVLRVAALGLDRTDLFVDEAQYWFWGQNLDFGYFSKPPMIGWVLRLVSELAPETPFWVRLPAPLFHGATALILARLAVEMGAGRTGAAWVAGLHLSLPIVSVGSYLISTDTIMAPFLAGAVLAWYRGGGAWAGLWLGLAFLSKYAAIYGLVGVALAQVFVPARRLSRRDLALFGAVFAVVISPNVIWNFANDLTTVSHTMDNVGWVTEDSDGPGIKPLSLLEFWASQALALGPLLTAGLVWAAARRRGAPWLWWFVAPALAVVSLQALLDKAFANWAFAGLVFAVPLAALALGGRPRWRAWAAGTNAVLCLVVPLAAAAPGVMRLPSGEPMAARYLGRADLSRAIAAAAEREGAAAIVADHRDVLADLFWTLDESLPRFAPRPEGVPGNFYEQTRALPEDAPEPILFATFGGLDCAEARRAGIVAPETGAYRGRTLSLFLAPASCF